MCKTTLLQKTSVPTELQVLDAYKSAAGVEAAERVVRRRIEVLEIWEKLLGEYSTQLQTSDMNFKTIRKKLIRRAALTKKSEYSFSYVYSVTSKHKLSTQIKILNVLHSAKKAIIDGQG